MPTSAATTFSATGRLDPVYGAADVIELPVRLKASLTYKHGQVLGELEGTTEVDTITLSATGGTFTVTILGQTTAPITASASLPTLAVFEEALEALTSVGENNVAVTGTPGGAYTLTFQNALANRAITTPTTNAASLTGGAGTATVAVVTAGSAGTKGTYAPYDQEATDGTQVARAFLRYDCVTDASGNITGPGEWGATELTIDAVVKGGIWSTADLIGLDAKALTDLGSALVQGTVASGLLRL